jgi:DNA-binding GntR family transcriptional regulator
MAARLITTTARKKDITALRDFFKDFDKDRLPEDHVEEYSRANIAFHQALISLSESPIIEALEARDTELAEKRARDHTLGLAAYVEAHGQELFT